MHKSGTVFSVNLSSSFTRTLERLLTQPQPATRPTAPEDKAKIDQRGHEVFRERRIK